MIRVLIYLVIVALLAFGAVWLAERPGDVVITWQGERVETSVMVLMAAAAAVAVAAVLLWSIARAIVRSPDAVSRFLRNRRGVRAYQAVSHGLIAVGSGDARAAKKFTAEAKRIAPSEPLTLLLSAQAAQLAGDRDAAAATFQQMAGRDDTRVLGLHGLFVEAQRRNDPAAALFYAEEAAKRAPRSRRGPGRRCCEFRCVAGDWSGALARLERNMKSGLIDKTAYRRQRAVLLTAQALAAEETERRDAQGARARGGEARARPGAGGGARRAAARRRRREAQGRAHHRGGVARQSASRSRRRLRPSAARRFRARAPGRGSRPSPARRPATPRPRSRSRAPRSTRRNSRSRAPRLVPLLATPTRRVAALMAALELQEGDEGRGREWMARTLNARRDPAWTADGHVSEHWLPVSPVTGRLDAFEWRDPLAGVDHTGATIDAEQRALLDAPRAPPPPLATALPASDPLAAVAPVADKPVPPEPAAESSAAGVADEPGLDVGREDAATSSASDEPEVMMRRARRR